ncbi:MAG: helicase-associated domain-containing protein [Chloroflexota bacterium]
MTAVPEALWNLTESQIQHLFDGQTWNLARRLVRNGHVLTPFRQGSTLFAEVVGDDDAPYEVFVRVTSGSGEAACSCGSSSWCEHVAALLLNWILDPDEFLQVSDVLPEGLLDHVDELAVDVAPGPPGRPLAPDRPPFRPQGPGAIQVTHTQSIERDLRSLLQEQTIQQLRAIARSRGWKLHGTRKDDLVDQLAELYLTAGDLGAVVQAWDDDHRLVLEFLALRCSVVPALEEGIKKTLRRLNGRRSEQEAVAMLQRFGENGLILSTRPRGMMAYRMPTAVVRRLPPWSGLLSPSVGAEDRLELQQTPPFALTQVAYDVWQYLAQTPHKARALPPKSDLENRWPSLKSWLNPPDELAALEKSKRYWYPDSRQGLSVQFLPPPLTEDDLASLRRRTAVDGEILDFTFSLLTTLGLVNWQYGEPIQTVPGRMTAFLSHADADRLQALFSAWLQTLQWSEMSLVLRHTKGLRLRRSLAQFDLTYNDLLVELAQARLIVVLLLQRLSPGKWYRIADLRQLLSRFWPDYLHNTQPVAHHAWWLETAESDYRLSPDKAADWELGYAPFISACLEGPLSWLGVIKLATTPKGAMAFQITELGSYLLGLRPDPGQATARPEGPALTVHGDGVVEARTGYASSGAYDVLNVAARLQEASVQAFRYRLTSESVRGAFEQGWTGQAVLDALQEHSGNPVPEPLRGQILAWARSYGQVHLYDEVTLIEFADDFALQELLASTSLAQHMVFQFSPRLIAIQSDAIDALRDELVKLGHTPRIE